jgi:hypothetical protein
MLKIPYNESENQELLNNPVFYSQFTQDEVDDLENLTVKI